MDERHDSQLALAAAAALVAAAVTEHWRTAEEMVHRLFTRWPVGGDIFGWNDVIATRKHIYAAKTSDGAAHNRLVEVSRWAGRFSKLLAAHPESAEDLRALVAGIARHIPAGDELLPADDVRHGQVGGAAPGSAETLLAGPPAPVPAVPPAPVPPGAPFEGTGPEPVTEVGAVIGDTAGWPTSAGPRERPSGQWAIDPETALRRAIQKAVKPGLLAFNPPAEMTQGRKERVEVAVARSAELRDALVAGLRGRGEVRIEDVPTSTVMGVELRGESFAIAALSPAEQIVAPTARWEFDVKPLQAGVQILTLCVSLRFDQLGHVIAPGSRIAVPVVERQIRIRVDLGFETRGFLMRNWQWLVGTAIAIGGLIATLLTVFH